MVAKPKKRKISLYLTEQYYDDILSTAQNRGVSMQAVIEELLRQSLQRNADVADFVHNAGMELRIAEIVNAYIEKAFSRMDRQRDSEKAA